MGWIATVTNKGYALQAKLLSTDKLNITRVVSGAGSCATTQLINQNAVTDIKQELIIDGLSYDKYDNARLKVTLNNINVTTSYGVSQIGIYATDPDEGEILYAIAQADEAEIVPSITEQPNGYYCSWDFSLTYSNAQNVNVTIDPSNAISQEEADKRYIQISKIGDNLTVDEDGTLSADAQQITVDEALSDSSTNPVQNKVVNNALNGKVDKVSGKGLSTNDYTTTEKNKLAGIAEGANKYSLPTASASQLGGVKVGSGLTISNGVLSATGTDVTIDSALSASSTNPVQNKVVNSALGNKVDKETGKGLSTNDYTTTEKNKLAGIAEGANKYTHPSYTAKTSGLYKVTVDNTGHVSGTSAVQKEDITPFIGISYQNASSDGDANVRTLSEQGNVLRFKGSGSISINFLSGNGNEYLQIDSPADYTLSADSTNPIRNKAVYNALAKKADADHTHTASSIGAAASDHTHTFDSLGVRSISLDGLIETDTGRETREPTDSEKNNLNGLKAAVLIGCQNKCVTTTGTNVGTCLAVGYGNEVYSEAVALGSNLKAWEGQTVVGEYNRFTGDGSDKFIVGGGSSDSSRTNVFRVSTDTNKCYGVNSFVSSGADYAEYMEWEDGNPSNEDRRGRMVAYALTDVECTVEDIEILHPDTHEPITVKAVVYEKMPPIRYANSLDECIGIITGSASFIGNSASEDWNNRFLKDIYGEQVKQAVLIPEKTETYEVKEIDEKTGEEVTVEKTEVIPEHWAKQFVLNPHYDSEKEYVSREFRQEWDPVGMVGMVVVEDDGTCVVGGYCKPSTNGIGTAAETGYRVLQRMDNTHVRVLVR